SSSGVIGVTAASMGRDSEPQRDSVRAMVTRRRLLEGSLAAAFGAYLAACGETGGARRSSTSAKPIPKAQVASSMYFANWPLYIDDKHESLKQFQEEYGTRIKYVEEINDNQ